MSPFYWERHPDGPFATLIAVAANYLDPENYDLDSLQALARLEDDEEMRVFKTELRQALRDPGQLPGEELSDSVEYDHGSDEAFLRWLWHALYGDEPFDTDVTTRLKALPEPLADRLEQARCWDRFAIGRAARAGDWGSALDMLLTALTDSAVPVSAAERGELTAMLEGTGRPADMLAGLAVAEPRAGIPAPWRCRP